MICKTDFSGAPATLIELDISNEMDYYDSALHSQPTHLAVSLMDGFQSH